MIVFVVDYGQSAWTGVSLQPDCRFEAHTRVSRMTADAEHAPTSALMSLSTAVIVIVDAFAVDMAHSLLESRWVVSVAWVAVPVYKTLIHEVSACPQIGTHSCRVHLEDSRSVLHIEVFAAG